MATEQQKHFRYARLVLTIKFLVYSEYQWHTLVKAVCVPELQRVTVMVQDDRKVQLIKHRC